MVRRQSFTGTAETRKRDKNLLHPNHRPRTSSMLSPPPAWPSGMPGTAAPSRQKTARPAASSARAPRCALRGGSCLAASTT